MKKRNSFLFLLLFLASLSLVYLFSDDEAMEFYQISALSLSSLSSYLPVINQTTIIIAVAILLVIIVGLIVIRLLKRKKSEGQEILAQTQQTQTQESSVQSMDARLAQYIRDARAAGLSNEIISQKLRDAGWPEETIRRAL